MEKMRIAFLGLRGIPGRYGGFETLVDHVAPGLVELGHDVTVYCRKAFNPENLKQTRGVRLVTLPAVGSKYLETVTHTLFCLPHVLFSRYDAVIAVNAINALFCLPLRAARVKVALNVDGLERKRKKWNLPGKWAYALSEYLSCVIPDVTITDAVTIRNYYLKKYGRKSTLLTYGGNLSPPLGKDILKKYRLDEGRYFLYVARFEPENHPDKVLRAYTAAGVPWPLVMVGDNPYRPGYVNSLKQMADSSVIFTGAVYGESYRQLLFHAGAVVLAFEVGGTHPALLEAMGAKKIVLLNDTEENREVAEDTALYFSVEDPAGLTGLLRKTASDPESFISRAGRAEARVKQCYTWDNVIDGYHQLVLGMVK